MRSLFDRALRESKNPRGGYKMALFGAETRHPLINLIDEVEAEIGQCAFAIAEDTGAMEINPKLIERFRKEADCGVLESAFDLAFPSPASKRRFNEEWAYAVGKHRGQRNTRELLREKSVILVSFVINNLNRHDQGAGGHWLWFHSRRFACRFAVERLAHRDLLQDLSRHARRGRRRGGLCGDRHKLYRLRVDQRHDVLFRHSPSYKNSPVAEPWGVGYFQIPTYAKGYAFGIDEYLCQIKEGHDRMEGHVLPQKDVIEIVYDCECKLLELREDKWTGDANWVSNTFLVQKGGSPAVSKTA